MIFLAITKVRYILLCSLFADIYLVGNEVVNRVKQIDRAASECIRVQGGISKQYFYRSLYVVQFYHCFKVKMMNFHQSIMSDSFDLSTLILRSS